MHDTAEYTDEKEIVDQKAIELAILNCKRSAEEITVMPQHCIESIP